MCPDVLLEVGQLGKLALTDLTSVGLDPQVDARVLGQVGTVREGLVACCTLVRLGLAHVDLGVQLKVSLAGKQLKYGGKVMFFFHTALIFFIKLLVQGIRKN